MPRCDSFKEKRCAQPFSEYSHSYMIENLIYFARQGLIFSYHIHTDCCVLFLLYKSLSMVLQLIEPKPTPMFQEHHLKKLVVASLLIFFFFCQKLSICGSRFCVFSENVSIHSVPLGLGLGTIPQLYYDEFVLHILPRFQYQFCWCFL